MAAAMDVETNRRPRLLLTVEEASDVLAIGRTTMFDLIRTGRVASVRIGRLRRVPMDALHAFARELER